MSQVKLEQKQQPSKPVQKVICIILLKKIIHLPLSHLMSSDHLDVIKTIMLMLKFILEKFRGPKIPQNKRKKFEINKKTEKLNTFAIYITDKLQNIWGI